jgi:DNA replication and repair protein RecF
MDLERMGLEGAGLVLPRVRRLTLADFRSYAQARCDIGGGAGDQLVVLVGENGAGKTNALEALSMFSAGRGLRRADLAECARHDGAGGYAVSIELDCNDGTTQLGHGLGPDSVRQFRIDRAPVASARAFADHLRVLWLTPAMDGLFAGPAGDRRRFLDRLALGVDADHGARGSRLERALRNRNRLLEEGVADRRWLAATEQEIAALGVAVAAARLETVSRLRGIIAEGREGPFPWAEIAIDGEIENRLTEAPALAVEEWFRDALAATRRRDAAAGRTLTGPQTSDLAVRHGPRDVAARECSTGEQKALLMGLTLAHARLVGEMTGRAPLLLLDEVAAHFDPKRRAALYDELEKLGGQVWMTGADPALFETLKNRATIFSVTAGKIFPA